MELRPILSAMLRNKTGAVLVAMQIAFTLAVIVNAVFIVSKRVEKMTRPNGMDVAHIITAQVWAIDAKKDIEQMARSDMEMLRAMPGVIDATVSHQVPLSGGGWGDELKSAPGEDKGHEQAVPGARYTVDDHAIATLGVTLAEGRNFRPDEIRYRQANSSQPIDTVILTKAMAAELFPDGRDPVGQTVYDDVDRPITIVGLIERMHGAWVGWDKLDNVMLSPEIASGPLVRYLVRTEPGQLNTLLPQVEQKLIDRDPDRVVRKVQPMSEVAARSYEDDRAMAVVLGIVVGILIVITALGIVGLASFSVKTRTKQIGTRRAVGARKIDIVRYFLLENWLITTFGVVAGVVLAVAANYVLVTRFSLDKLNPLYVPAGILGLWALGLLSVLGPARRAAAIPPAVATRTV
jgi:putative ABC transport system permease protein